MRKYWIMLALCLAACCGGAELKPFHGDNYILDCRSGIAISVKQKNGDFAPFLSGIGFDATDKDWKTFFRSAGFRALPLRIPLYRPRCETNQARRHARSTSGLHADQF